MAIDGVKIIDSDTAHDVYGGFMDMYDGGEELSVVEATFPLENEEYSQDALDYELYVTACGLALWETGLMDENKLAFIRSVIDKGAFIKAWDPNGPDGKARQKELDRYWKKISQPNPKIRARKKYRKVTRFYFQPYDLLAFQLDNGYYMAALCAEIFQQRGVCEYMLVPTTYYGEALPAVEDLHSCHLLGRTIESFYDTATTKKMQPNIERIWKYLGGNPKCFFGLSKYGLLHRDAAICRRQLQKIGTLPVVEGLNDTAIRSTLSGFESLRKRFYDAVNGLEEGTSRMHQSWPVNIVCNIE
ncbi:hypothetical protein SAMN04488128_10923 [Chitinophaga eiseniae]|uniref:Uncharacterized protein n=1 Tax=Chitinophaga eiseniae TaxID=634771 RepID=A0A1T4U4M0_9BACT|nr:hypothetical protein [Chitinophaga eiseniae]SKA47702.1 hypothetical protein SAMN04488128_10923 [Chitinophaga eiseniae]